MGVREAAEATARRARRSAHAINTRPRYGIIVGVSPLAVQLVGSSLELDEDDVALCQQVRIYHRDFGLERGDTLILMDMGRGEFVATAVLSDKDVSV